MVHTRVMNLMIMVVDHTGIVTVNCFIEETSPPTTTAHLSYIYIFIQPYVVVVFLFPFFFPPPCGRFYPACRESIEIQFGFILPVGK